MKIASFEKREWIDPWRDRRPMTPDTVLVTAVHNGKRLTSTASYYNNEQIEDCPVYVRDGWSIAATVIAWMPLPIPFDPSEEEEETDED